MSVRLVVTVVLEELSRGRTFHWIMRPGAGREHQFLRFRKQ